MVEHDYLELVAHIALLARYTADRKAPDDVSKASLASVESIRSMEHFGNRPTIRLSDISRLEFRGQVLLQEFG